MTTTRITPDPDERKQFWSAEDIQKVAAEEGIDQRDLSLSSIQCSPSGLSRRQIVAALHMLAGIPRDDPFARHP